MFKHLVLLAGCGALGTLLRYYAISLFTARDFPWPTLSVNVLGSILMGLAYVLIVDKGLVSEALKPYVMTAFLGAFTTFSAFSLEIFVMLEKGEWFVIASYVLSSVLLCIGLLALTVYLARLAL